MRPWAALEIALALAERPDSFRGLGTGPLPSGVTLLLEVAVGELAALEAARVTMARPHAALRSAASVFIERVLFAEAADSYRILGAGRGATRRHLRRHMVLLVKWLHRDAPDWSPEDRGSDRDRLFPRVTQAWEHVKTDSRRAAYDQSLIRGSVDKALWNPALTAALHPREGPLQLIAFKPRSRRASRRLVIYRVPNDTLFSRLLYYLGRHA